jgi:hypothetical protein
MPFLLIHMGSGTGGYDVPSKTTDEIKRIISDAIPKVDDKKQSDSEGPKVRNIFISFHNEDEPQVNLLRVQAKRENTDLEFRDYSVKEPVEQWRTHVKEKIATTSATIVMIGPETASRPNVQYEIEQSYAQGKKVIGVRISKDRNDPIPKIMKDHNAPIINWNLKEIQAELDKP